MIQLFRGKDNTMFDAVVFDFDYTLADSSSGILKCIQYALHELGLPPASEDRMRESIGLTLSKTLTFLTGIDDVQTGEEFTRLFVSHADEIMADLTVMYDTAPPVITALRQAGIPLGIVSTKYRYRIESILHRDDLLSHFDIIVGGEDVAEHKPHPSSLLRALSHLNCSPERGLYIGDHPVDAEAAHRAGVPFIAVLTGTSTQDQFDPFDRHEILAELSPLPRLLGL